MVKTKLAFSELDWATLNEQSNSQNHKSKKQKGGFVHSRRKKRRKSKRSSMIKTKTRLKSRIRSRTRRGRRRNR